MASSVTVIDPPALLVNLATAKAHLKVDAADDDALIESYLAAVCGHLDGPDGWLDRAIGPQTLELRVDAFIGHDSGIPLPYPPIVAIDSVAYLDEAGAEQTLDVSAYEIAGSSRRPELRAAFGQSFPITWATPGAVRVTYSAGYEDVPPAIVAAVLLMVGDLYAMRETVVTGTIAAAIPMSVSVERLLAPFRIWSV